MGYRQSWLELEFQAFVANVIVDDSIEAAFVTRKAKAVGAGSIKTRGPRFHDGSNPLVGFPTDAFAASGPATRFNEATISSMLTVTPGRLSDRILPSFAAGKLKPCNRHSTARRVR